MPWTLASAVALASYLVGSVPTGYLVGRAKGVDLRKEGSGNIGATNALRVLGKKLGYFVFAADVFKGALAVLLANFVAGRLAPEHAVTFQITAAVFALLGHNFPVWLGFKGGKGIATSAGIMIALYPLVFPFGVLIWLILFYTTRYVSIASIAGSLSLPIGSAILSALGKSDWRLTAVATLMCMLAVWRHKSNIQRLLAGTEKRFEKKARPQGG